MLKSFFQRRFPDNFERIFVVGTFLLIAFILYGTDQKLAFLNFYFIPVLLAGYFLNTRSAVLGAVFCILVVGFCYGLHPEYFLDQLDDMGSALHLVSWGSFLILTGYLSGCMNQMLRNRFEGSAKTLSELNMLQACDAREHRHLEEKNASLQKAKERLESALHVAMDPLVATLAASGELQSGVRSISILSLELPAFGLSEDPEATLKPLSRFFSSMESILTQYWGHLEKYTGNGLVAQFGMLYPLTQHALLAALAGLKMQERMAVRDFPWKMRLGLASGPAWVGLLGSGSRLSYTALGSSVLRAEKLKSSCAPAQVLIDAPTYMQIRHWFHARQVLGRRSLNLKHEAWAQAGGEVESKARHALAGKEETAYELLGLKDPLEDERRIPAHVTAAYHQTLAQVRLPLDMLQPIEALECAIGHGQVTAALCAALAQALEATEREARTAFLAGCLHDIGKKNVPENLLKSEHSWEDLSIPEQNLIQGHAREAANVLRELDLPTSPALNDAIAQHHERYDGSGYPQGLKGEQICLPARIIQVADTYETLTGFRPYHEPLGMDAALKEIARGVEEGVFDPRAGKAFLRMMQT